jgi:hypothetical protein
MDVSRPPGVTTAFRVALEEDTEVADPVVTVGANPIIVKDFTLAVVFPIELVASYV